jgi:Uma2 family endonuclease
MPLVSPLTIEDFERLPDALALNHELVDGELVEVSGNTLIHNRLRDLLILLLREYVEKHGLGEVVSEQEFDFDGNVHGPDIAFFSPEKMPLTEPNRRVQRFVPDLAIEIVSENDTFRKLMKKAARYQQCGVKESWILDPESRRSFLFSDIRSAILGDHDQFVSDLIPGFSIRLGDLFDRR